MSDEPLYCTHCGHEWGHGHADGCKANAPDYDDVEDGPHCHICGVAGENMSGHCMCAECHAAIGGSPW